MEMSKILNLREMIADYDKTKSNKLKVAKAEKIINELRPIIGK